MVLWTRHPSSSARLLAARITELGTKCKHVIAYEQPDNSIAFGHASNKYTELVRLSRAGLPIPEHGLQRGENLTSQFERGWFARTYHHQRANDLLAGITRGDYYVKKVETIREHRVHVFDGQVIRVQMKQADGPHAHPWIRSSASGWTLVARPEYTDLLPRGARNMARLAVKTMGYTWGAVDIGTQQNGSCVVFEVNSAPGMKCPGTTNAYAKQFIAKYA